MINLTFTTLGGCEVRSDSGSPIALPTRKAKALLVYLAMAGGEPQARGKLAALLWDRSAEEQARASLRQTLSALRKALGAAGADVPATDGESIRLAAEGIEVDALTFMRLINTGTLESLEQAMGLYKGEFLEGFALREEPFEEWLMAERARLHELAVQGVAKLLTHHAEAGAVERAIQLASQLLVLDPLQENAHRVLMRLYAEQGRLGAALKQYETCARMLQRELGVAPMLETQELYQRIAARRATEEPVKASSGADEVKATDMNAATLQAAVAAIRSQTPKTSTSAIHADPFGGKPALAVLPFRNMSQDPDQEYFADGVTEDLITSLSSIRWLFVIARNSSFTYKGQSPNVQDVASALGVRYVLQGSVRKAENRVRITAQLVDSTTGTHVWANRYDRDLEDIFALQDELTETIIGAIEPELGKAERQRARSMRPENLDAWDLYQRGLAQLYKYTKESLTQAQQLFLRAIELDPDLSPAFSASAEAYYIGLVYGLADSPEQNRNKALVAARRAVELDSTDSAAHCTLGRVYYLRREHDLAIPELEIALELNPSFAWAHYGAGAALVFSGRAKEAIPYLEHAIRLSPRDPYMGSFLVRMADAHLFMRQYDKAVEWARKALREPHFQWSRHAVLVSALGHLGRSDEVHRALDELLRLRADFTLAFVRKYHLISDPDDMAHYLEGLRNAGVSD
ncbi:MAG: BTAD domain-containing putative transcriptional regulator [Acidiferrobacterales bacterium]